MEMKVYRRISYPRFLLLIVSLVIAYFLLFYFKEISSIV